MTRMRAAIVGTGDVARLHAEAIAARDDADVVVAVDVDADRAAAFAQKYGIPRSATSLPDGHLDVVHLCTPPAGHAAQAEDAFARGAHVVVEKPPALTLHDVDRMIAAGDAAGRHLAVVFQQRTGTATAHVKRLLDDGRLGRPLLARCDTFWFRDDTYFAAPWRGTWANEGGGTTLGHGIHQLDLLAYLLGEVDEVQGQTWRLARDIETEDVSTAVLRFESGVVATAMTSAVSPRQVSSIRVDTELATVELEHLYGHGHANWRITPRPGADAPSGWTFPAAEQPSGHDAYIDAVYPALAAGAALPDVASAPARSMEIVAALYASSERSAAVALREVRESSELRGQMSAQVRDERRS
ncbi:Gfo/Idh/MocA family protein [Pseudoclavibacter sp. VKM Ac-2867]|uniref:Gfo/Idh/MocA family protein n=1 Tax=Pseudoclavibacter sp. VKM Ac-2867 TaxID=2783829 RepID=UPI00188D4D44|nr:Gfo/Idh/MocA family oxidoreductase [Pseudoclavibacter sp. VKM Ac-2867]MBF4460766.1 Gfo/Idh/MocA family oxidoreductase [Pseudoclavibacter sp. VKM Ac-2867]